MTAQWIDKHVPLEEALPGDSAPVAIDVVASRDLEVEEPEGGDANKPRKLMTLR